jgi:hypothetical protein
VESGNSRLDFLSVKATEVIKLERLLLISFIGGSFIILLPIRAMHYQTAFNYLPVSVHIVLSINSLKFYAFGLLLMF